MTEDVLEKWALYIEGAEEGLLEYPDECECISDLAAEIRALRLLAELGRMVKRLPEGYEVAHARHDAPDPEYWVCQPFFASYCEYLNMLPLTSLDSLGVDADTVEKCLEEALRRYDAAITKDTK